MSTFPERNFKRDEVHWKFGLLVLVILDLRVTWEFVNSAHCLLPLLNSKMVVSIFSGMVELAK